MVGVDVMVVVIAVAVAIVGVDQCPAVNLSSGALVSRLECQSLPDMPVRACVHEHNVVVPGGSGGLEDEPIAVLEEFISDCHPGLALAHQPNIGMPNNDP